MKTKHLFTFAFAAFALAFAGCSDDDDVRNVNSKPVPGEKGALVEGISINFGESQGAKTRAYSGTQSGEGTEGMIYEAFIFAKEANPTHSRPLDGDWTVIRVTTDGTTVYKEIGGVNTETITKDKLNKAINESSISEQQWLVQNVANFKGVRQGDYVYVIANDPNLTLSQAATLAHAGEKSEDAIKGYIANINKDYLNGLTFAPEKEVTNSDGKKETLRPSGKFFMAGREIIPVSPNIPSNGTFSMTIGLDRELSKVSFTASISTNDKDAAKGKVAFQNGDGIIVARIARKASPFAEQVPDWYVPANNCVENWPINDHTLVNGAYSSFCDGTREGSFVFDGTSTTPITDWIAGTTIPANFNGVAPASNVTEYRYIWKLQGEKEDLINSDNLVHLSPDLETIKAPVFYTTPNYSNNTNSVTVICTQATYTHRGVFKNSNMIDTYVEAALNETESDIEIFSLLEAQAADQTATEPITVENPLKFKYENAQAGSSDDIAAKMNVAIKNWGIKMFTKEDDYTAAVGKLVGDDATTWNDKGAPDFETYQSMMDRFYVAVLLQQRLANKGKGVDGTKTDETYSAWGNGIPSGTTGFYTNADTDSLMLGSKKIGDEKVYPALYFHAGMKNLDTQKLMAKVNYNDPAPDAGVKTGAQIRAEYFADLASYEYVKGQKLYYRADVADYVGGVSNKLTERNMYYVSRGTIQSLGAKSIHDAIYSEQNTMHIDVKVNDWKLSINDIPM